MADMRGVANTNTLAAATNDAYRGLAVDRLGGIFTADLKGLAARAAAAGRLIVASDADFDDALLGTTTLANTTPLLMLRVPAGSCAVPLSVELAQAGTVAGGAITVLIEVNDTDDWSSGGAAETLFYLRNGAGFVTGCSVYSLPTAANAFGAQVYGRVAGMDVVPAEGADNRIVWTPEYPLPLIGPACLKVYANAAVTGPTLLWSLKFLDLPPAMFTN